MMNTLSERTGRPLLPQAALVAIGMAVTVGAALAFEHVGGFIPCALCLEQRTPYYLGIPVMLAAALSAGLKGPALLTRGLMLVGGALMLWGLYLGGHHAGVEWGWWAGPADCGVVAPTETGGRSALDALDAFVPPACDQAAGRFLGLSFAGWNVVASAILAGLAFRFALARPKG
ncbi:disulfide bond formation protein B [Chelativorans sp. ZYF759]|uniref:disulfide bond formation protein B n=1 Tax=Chelativorans sp. ZYF759 TaxID=2692213 RepID=UPI00145C46C1|nr:disulfide bond formation protein B [Chelativorans sp. ZYF759]NMG38299.1 disulfide bond formation protein B [Chelativorans sp. ZYF759]